MADAKHTTTRPDPAARIGREIARLWREYNALDDEWLATKAGGRSDALAAEMDRALRRIRAQEEMLCTVMPTSVAGAVSQIVLASGRISLARVHEEDREQLLFDAAALVENAAKALSRSLGVSLDAHCGPAYLTPEPDTEVAIAA